MSSKRFSLPNTDAAALSPRQLLTMGKIPPGRGAQQNRMVTQVLPPAAGFWVMNPPSPMGTSQDLDLDCSCGACCRSCPVWPTGSVCEGSDDFQPPHCLTAHAFSWKKCGKYISLNSHSSEYLHWQMGFSVHFHWWAGLHQGKSCFLPLSGNNPQDPRYCQAAGERREEHIMTWVSVLNHCAASSR